MSSGPSTGQLRIDQAAECIWRDGEQVNVPPKAFQVLRHLMRRPKQLVTKQELMDAVWPDTHVIETVLNMAIRQLRQALGDDSKQARFIETVHRRGFRWIGPVAADEANAPPRNAIEEDASAFVGRAETLAALQQCFTRAASGHRAVVFVTGEAGIGKTSVIDHFIRDRKATCRIARGQCVESYGAGDAYRP